MWLFFFAFLQPSFLELMALTGVRSVPVGGLGSPTLPSLPWLGMPDFQGKVAYVGGVIVDFCITYLPIPTRLHWYGLDTAIF